MIFFNIFFVSRQSHEAFLSSSYRITRTECCKVFVTFLYHLGIGFTMLNSTLHNYVFVKIGNKFGNTLILQEPQDPFCLILLNFAQGTSYLSFQTGINHLLRHVQIAFHVNYLNALTFKNSLGLFSFHYWPFISFFNLNEINSFNDFTYEMTCLHTEPPSQRIFIATVHFLFD